MNTKTIKLTLSGFLLSTLFIYCGDEAKPSIKPSDTVATKTATIEPQYEAKTDTTFRFTINKTPYLLMIRYDEIRSTVNENRSTTTVRILRNNEHDTLYKQTFDFNTFGGFFHPAADCFWFSLLDYGGGSGYSGTLFKIKTTPQITLQPLLNINELSFWKSNKTATELLLIQAMWNMYSDADEEDFEAHFSDHKQWIGKYKIEDDTILLTEIGITQNKYSFSENGNALKELRKKEPAIADSIQWENYE